MNPRGGHYEPENDPSTTGWGRGGSGADATAGGADTVVGIGTVASETDTATGIYRLVGHCCISSAVYRGDHQLDGGDGEPKVG